MADDRSNAELGRVIDRLEGDIGDLEAKALADNKRLDRLATELANVRERTAKAEAEAAQAKKALDAEMRAKAEREAALTLIGRWVQLMLGVAIAIYLAWNGQFQALLAKLQGLIGSGK